MRETKSLNFKVMMGPRNLTKKVRSTLASRALWSFLLASVTDFRWCDHICFRRLIFKCSCSKISLPFLTAHGHTRVNRQSPQVTECVVQKDFPDWAVIGAILEARSDQTLAQRHLRSVNLRVALIGEQEYHCETSHS